MLTDTHCHLYDPALGEVSAVLAHAAVAGVTRVVAVGNDPSTNLAALGLARQHPAVLPAFGFHPERVSLDDGELDQVESQVAEHRAHLVALGEIGLPWYSLEGHTEPARLAAKGRERLLRLLALASRLDLPVILHAPHDAAAEALALLARVPVRSAVFHWHKALPGVTRTAVERGHFLGITPEVCYRERDRVLVGQAPLASLLLESDGPWPYAGEFVGRPGEPSMVARAAEAIAAIRGLPLEETVAALAANTQRYLGRPAGCGDGLPRV